VSAEEKNSGIGRSADATVQDGEESPQDVLFGKSATVDKNATKPRKLRLDFTPDSKNVVRARLRSGSGKNRSKKNGGAYVPLGRIEDVYNDPYYQEFHGRCEEYAERTGYKLVKTGSGIRSNNVPANGRMDEAEIPLVSHDANRV